MPEKSNHSQEEDPEEKVDESEPEGSLDEDSASNVGSQKSKAFKALPYSNHKDLLTEIITRKDNKKKGGSSIFKAHQSFYNHMRRMRKATTAM